METGNQSSSGDLHRPAILRLTILVSLKQEHGKVVPTWNYEVVHAHGYLTFFEDKQRCANSLPS